MSPLIHTPNAAKSLENSKEIIEKITQIIKDSLSKVKKDNPDLIFNIQQTREKFEVLLVETHTGKEYNLPIVSVELANTYAKRFLTELIWSVKLTLLCGKNSDNKDNDLWVELIENGEMAEDIKQSIESGMKLYIKKS
ncbi:hypothetical protein K8Q96_00925 [Candidatus Nomurabacteria bacterium]|nr:hypothetical protein [Candidatus Nomurabacteria bacterium]